MHKLSRPSQPVELAQAKRSYTGNISQDEAWKAFDKNSAREALRIAQNGLCGYCESMLTQTTRIDHFEPKKHHYALTFDWDNVVLSCDEKDSCDCKKGGNFNNYWINPYVTDPTGMFKFYADGQVQGLSVDAQNIIEDFGLDCPSLETKRKGVLSTLQHTLFALLDEPEALAYFLQEEADMFPTAYQQIIHNTIGV
jgi:uncharacterized protein (TIGR02646 family)